LDGRIAMISMHTCPLETPGGIKAGGMNVCVRELARALSHQGVALDIFTRWRGVDQAPQVKLEETARVIRLPAGPVAWVRKDELFGYLPEFLHSLQDFVQREGLRYGLVHGHYWLSGWVAAQLKAAWHIPMVQSFHTLGEVKNLVAENDEEREPRLRIEHEREIVAQADIVIAADTTERDQLVELYGADPARIRMAPCGVDTELFRPIPRAEARGWLGLGLDEKIVLFVGRLEALKGLDTLLPAFAQVNGHFPRPPRLLVVGGDLAKEAPKFESLRQMATTLGIAERVSLLGVVEQPMLPYYYSAADVLAMPSYTESLGMVAIEAMACGTPVVVSRVGGLQHTVLDGETGYQVPPRDPPALAERLNALLSDPALAARLGQKGIQRAAEYSWRIVAQGVLAVYQELGAATSGKEVINQ
jgi:D-inositol-3-phosphate glycosyltransferase